LPGTVISITGSNGKTTVKRMVAHILSRHLAGLASPKSFNNNIGVPLTLLSAGPEDKYVICETGSNAPGEIATLAAIERPDIAVITSVGETHLEKLIDIEHVAAEKASLLGSLDPRGLAIVNADSIPLERALRGYSCRMIRFGRSEKADVRLTGFEPTEGGCRFQLNGRRWFDLAVPGEHMACNALAAIAVAQRLGFEQDQAGEALADYRGEEMRLQMIQAGSVRIINDAYNANPASMAAAAASLASYSAQRKVVVAGDMRELGPQGVALHAAVGDKMAHAGVDLVIGVGLLGRHIASGAQRAGASTAQIDTVEEACRKLPALLREGDLVLIKGSRGMKMERLVEPIQAAFGYQGQGCCTERKN
jgi:UDP-N-acetylmuramoyl-tripeptide--D-alanyl-D-alanine ligase